MGGGGVSLGEARELLTLTQLEGLTAVHATQICVPAPCAPRPARSVGPARLRDHCSRPTSGRVSRPRHWWHCRLAHSLLRGLSHARRAVRAVRIPGLSPPPAVTTGCVCRHGPMSWLETTALRDGPLLSSSLPGVRLRQASSLYNYFYKN